ncbi:MAG: hypothetical protein ACJ77A_03115 [Actinomycetota bacterium]
MWERWISEVVADLFSIARVGVSSTMGLIGLVSLPRAFVFRMSADDPHPFSWIRVHVSCAFGEALYPDRQWRRLASVWTSFYPAEGLPAQRRRVLQALLATMPAFVRLVLGHRPGTLRGRTVGDAVRTADRTPDRLIRLYAQWTADPRAVRRTRPALAFAVVGQARARGLITPEGEDRLLGRLISYWALESTLRANAALAARAGAQPAPGLVGPYGRAFVRRRAIPPGGGGGTVRRSPPGIHGGRPAGARPMVRIGRRAGSRP